MNRTIVPSSPAGADRARPPGPSAESGGLLGDRAVLLLALGVFALHLVVNLVTPYGVHRDELLYLAMGRHLRLLHMDFPPLIAILAETERLLGDSLLAIRLLPAAAHGLIILLAARFASDFGGGRFARLLAGATVAVQPVFMRPGALFQPVVFDQLWWTLGLLALLRAGRATRRSTARRAWIAYGVVCGIGLLTKFSILIFGFATLLAVLLTPLRRWLATPWPWLAAAISLLIGAPSIAGQLNLHFPVIGQMRDLNAGQLERVGPLEFIQGQLLMIGLGFPLAIAGVARLLRRGADAGERAVAWTTIACFALLLAMHGKAYYVAPIYPALLGAGAAALSAWSAGMRRGRALAVRAATALLVPGLALLTIPFGLPILPPAPMARYAAWTGITEGVRTNWGEVLELPQDYADMLPWEGQAAAVGRVYASLTPDERAQVVIAADNYGEAGALDFHGPRWGLPPAVAPVGSYWYFGPGDRPGNVLIKLGGDAEGLQTIFRSCRVAAYADSRWAVPYERHVPIFLCHGPYRPLQELWPGWEGNN
jgi:hypothetical protein